jgi:hypothetical protein
MFVGTIISTKNSAALTTIILNKLEIVKNEIQSKNILDQISGNASSIIYQFLKLKNGECFDDIIKTIYRSLLAVCLARQKKKKRRRRSRKQSLISDDSFPHQKG